MRKTFLTTAAGVIISFGLSAQLLCGTYDDFDAKFNHVGGFHNALLDNIRNNFTPPGSVSTKSEAIDYIRDFNRNYFQQHLTDYFPKPMPRVEVNEIFESTKSYVNYDQFRVGLFTQGSGISLDDCMAKITNTNVLDAGNLAILQGTVNVIKNANEGAAADQLENEIVGLANSWLTQNDGKSGNGKELTGYILAVGLKSQEWWNNNLGAAILLRQMGETNEDVAYAGPSVNNKNSENMFYAFPWLADLAGSVVSGTIYAVVHANHLDLESLGQAALAGGISSSAGFVNKVIKFFKKLF